MSDTRFLNILPDPSYGRDEAGFEYNENGGLGQPFASFTLINKQPIQTDKTISGRAVNRMKVYNKWNVDIKYNPMSKAHFDPIYLFLMQRRGRLNPFFVSLPQYKAPKDSGFAYQVSTVESVLVPAGPSFPAGSNTLDITHGWDVTDNYDDGLPSIGDLFTVRDDFDTLHTKAYMVTRVETTRDGEYLEGNKPADLHVRIHFTPGLQREVPGATFLNFNDPMIQVVQMSDITEYSLNTEDLYSFSVRLEEAFY